MRALVFLSTLLGLSYSVISNRNSRRLCFYGWTQFEQDCYKAYKMRAQFMEAENKCNEVGAHLTSIHSVEENDFLREFTRTGNVQENKCGLDFSLRSNLELGNGSTVLLPTIRIGQREPNFMEYDSEGQASMMPDSSFNEKNNWYNPDGGEWNNLHDMPLRGFICKQKKSSIHILI